MQFLQIQSEIWKSTKAFSFLTKASLPIVYVVFIAMVCKLFDDTHKETEIQDSQS